MRLLPPRWSFELPGELPAQWCTDLSKSVHGCVSNWIHFERRESPDDMAGAADLPVHCEIAVYMYAWVNTDGAGKSVYLHAVGICVPRHCIYLWFIYFLFYHACLSVDTSQIEEINIVNTGWLTLRQLFLTVNKCVLQVRWKCCRDRQRASRPRAKKSSQMAWSISALHSVGARHGPVGFSQILQYVSMWRVHFGPFHLLCTNWWSRNSSINSTSKNKVSQWIEAQQVMSKAPR